MTVFDRFLFRLIGFLSLLLLSYSLAGNWGVAALIAFLIMVLIDRGLALLTSRKQTLKKISVSELEETFALLGSQEQQTFFSEAIPSTLSPKIEESGVTFLRNDEKEFLLPSYKFSPIGYDDVAKALRDAFKTDSKKIHIIGKKPRKEVVLFSRKFGTSIDFIPTRNVLHFLYSQNKLPKRIFEIPNKNKKSTIAAFFEKMRKKKIRETLSEWKSDLFTFLSDTFSRRRAKFFLLSSLSLAFIALFVPWTVYYVTFSAIALIMSLICLTRARTY